MNAASNDGKGRLLVLGSAALTDGFALIGAEVFPDATPEVLEKALESLVRESATALVLVEHYLSRGEGEWLNRLRNEGGSIVVTELPALSMPGAYSPVVDDVVRQVLGADSLEPAT